MHLSTHQVKKVFDNLSFMAFIGCTREASERVRALDKTNTLTTTNHTKHEHIHNNHTHKPRILHKANSSTKPRTSFPYPRSPIASPRRKESAFSSLVPNIAFHLRGLQLATEHINNQPKRQ